MRLATAWLAAPVLAAALAVPLRAQAGRDSVFRTAAFEIALPAGYPQPTSTARRTGGLDTRIYLSPGKLGALTLVQVVFPSAPLDTALAVRRTALEEARIGMMESLSLAEAGKALEVVREERVGLLLPMTMVDDEGELYGLAELAVPRRGPLQVWLVGFFSPSEEHADSPDVRRVLRSFRLFPAVEERDTSDVFAWVEGTWEWSESEAPERPTPFSIGVSPDRGTVRLEYERAPEAGDTARAYSYRVLGHGPDHIRASLEGETRLDSLGQAVVWDFVRVARDVFCWRRGDWGASDCTTSIKRVRRPAGGEPPDA